MMFPAGALTVTSSPSSLPISALAMGNEEGEEVSVKAPAGDIIYEILEVQYL